MENKKKVLKEFKEEITKKYGESALDIINKQLLILHKLPEINQKILIGVEDLIKRKLNKSGGADIKSNLFLFEAKNNELYIMNIIFIYNKY